MVDIKPEEKTTLKFEKKRRLRNSLESMAISLVKMSPKIAKLVVGATPFAFSADLVGEAFENMVKAVLKEQI